MKTYQFNYSVVPTDNSWWCDIRKQSFECKADDLKKANEMFIAHMDDEWCVTISKTAAKKPRKMYRESAKGDLPRGCSGDRKLQNWDMWEKLQTGIAYRGGAGYVYTIQSWGNYIRYNS